jgi:hypothetical protein
LLIGAGRPGGVLVDDHFALFLAPTHEARAQEDSYNANEKPAALYVAPLEMSIIVSQGSSGQRLCPRVRAEKTD